MPTTASGVLEILPRGGGFLRDPAKSFQQSRDDAFVPEALIRRYGLVTGAFVGGVCQPGRQGPQLTEVETVSGVAPEAFRTRTPFGKLVATSPNRRFHLSDSGNTTMRIIDLFAPVGRGTRGLIASPPKAGKTQLLEDFAKAIHADAPETRIVVLLVDERPEEVTHFRRQVPVEVIASSSDQGTAEHVRVANLCMAQVRCELEAEIAAHHLQRLLEHSKNFHELGKIRDVLKPVQHPAQYSQSRTHRIDTSCVFRAMGESRYWSETAVARPAMRH
jgi:transcription termination factor Rho